MSELEKLGKVIAEDLRDSALNRYLDLESGLIASDVAKELSKKIGQLSDDQKSLVRKIITDCVDVGVHDFLFAIGESRENVEIHVNGKNVTELSDGLQGEIFTEDGWFEIFSQHKEKGI